jgi:YggT family protein
MGIILNPLLEVALILIKAYQWTLIVYVVLNLLTLFNILGRGNQFIDTIHDFLARLIEPIVRKIRSVLPTFGAFDVSLLVLFLLTHFFEKMIQYILLKYLA